LDGRFPSSFCLRSRSRASRLSTPFLATDAALRRQVVAIVFAEAAASSHPATKNVYFDMTTNIVPRSPDAWAEFMTARIRQIGADRILYGSDMAIGGNLPAAESWRTQRERLGVTRRELETISGNVAPFLKWRVVGALVLPIDRQMASSRVLGPGPARRIASSSRFAVS
jgi:hypothetical protein